MWGGTSDQSRASLLGLKLSSLQFGVSPPTEMQDMNTVYGVYRATSDHRRATWLGLKTSSVWGQPSH